MMRKMWYFLLLALLVLLPGCKAKQESQDTLEEDAYLEQEADKMSEVFESGTFVFYYTDADSQSISESEMELDLRDLSVSEKVDAILQDLQDPTQFTEAAGSTSIIPEGCLKSYDVTEAEGETVCNIYLTSSYNDLKANQKVIMRTGIDRSLFETGEISRVAYYLKKGSKNTLLTSDTSDDQVVINQYDNEFYSDIVTVDLYFENTERTGLTVEKRQITMNMTDTLQTRVLEALMEGPEDETLNSLIPDGTRINSVWIKDAIGYVDLSAEFADLYLGSAEEAPYVIYGIVDTLTDLSGISYVQILIDGAVVDEYAGIVDISSPLSGDTSFVSEE